MLTYVQFNLFDSPAQTIVNTVNTVGVMGKGIALSYKQLYPNMFKQYRKLCKQGEFQIGMLHIYRTPNKIILNFPTKKHWRQKSKIEYLTTGLDKFVNNYSNYGISSIAFPQLGCGNGELNWEEQVQPLMEKYLKDLPIPVYIHLYEQIPTFVPERLDLDYSSEVHLERQRLSVNDLWNDLDLQINNQVQLDLFAPQVQINDDMIVFDGIDKSLKLYREDFEELWNVLRIRGTISIEDLPRPIQENAFNIWLFDLLAQLDYISAIQLQSTTSSHINVSGLRYNPPPAKGISSQIELVV